MKILLATVVLGTLLTVLFQINYPQLLVSLNAYYFGVVLPLAFILEFALFFKKDLKRNKKLLFVSIPVFGVVQFLGFFVLSMMGSFYKIDSLYKMIYIH